MYKGKNYDWGDDDADDVDFFFRGCWLMFFFVLKANLSFMLKGMIFFLVCSCLVFCCSLHVIWLDVIKIDVVQGEAAPQTC